MVLLSTLSGAMRATIKKVTVWCKEVDNRSGVTPAEQVAGTRYDAAADFGCTAIISATKGPHRHCRRHRLAVLRREGVCAARMDLGNSLISTRNEEQIRG